MTEKSVEDKKREMLSSLIDDQFRSIDRYNKEIIAAHEMIEYHQDKADEYMDKLGELDDVP